MVNNFFFRENYNYETNYIKIIFYKLSKNYKNVYKTYDNSKMFTIVDGLKHVKINKNIQFEYDQSDFIILPPNTSVEMVAKKDTIAIAYEISNQLIQDIKSSIQINPKVDVLSYQGIIKEKLSSEMKFIIERINSLCKSYNKNKAFLINLCSQELAYQLIANNFISVNCLINNFDPVIYTINYLKKNVLKPIKIKEIAANLNMSPSNLTLIFKKRMNMTPKEYQNILKLNASKEQLKHKNVTEVSYELGFDNISYFIKLFKNYFGETPKHFSKRIK